jgi:hypothetical protein
MSASTVTSSSSGTSATTGQGRKLVGLALGLTVLIAAMLCAFALPAVNSGPRDIPIGLSGQQAAVSAVEKALTGDNWEITQYDSEQALTSAIKNRDIMGGLALSSEGTALYTATAAGPVSTASLTAAAGAQAAQHRTQLTVKDVVPFPESDAKGAGFASALLPMIFGGMVPAVVLTRLFPGHSRLRLRLTGSVLFAGLAGFAVTAILQYATGSLAGNYWLTSLGTALGIAALSLTLLGLEANLGMAGFGLGAATMMLLANPLSGFVSGPHWLPDGWAAFGQSLPPGASGSLLRANAFFDGNGAGEPALVLASWTALGLALLWIAQRRGARNAAASAPVDAPSAA